MLTYYHKESFLINCRGAKLAEDESFSTADSPSVAVVASYLKFVRPWYVFSHLVLLLSVNLQSRYIIADALATTMRTNTPVIAISVRHRPRHSLAVSSSTCISLRSCTANLCSGSSMTVATVAISCIGGRSSIMHSGHLLRSILQCFPSSRGFTRHTLGCRRQYPYSSQTSKMSWRRIVVAATYCTFRCSPDCWWNSGAGLEILCNEISF